MEWFNSASEVSDECPQIGSKICEKGVQVNYFMDILLFLTITVYQELNARIIDCNLSKLQVYVKR